jgi:hypothetical protein
MKKLIIVLIVLLLIAGCDFGPTEEEDIVGCPLNFNCASGNDGVDIEIKDPPGDMIDVEDRIVYYGERFKPWFRITDLGESDVEGEICIAGLDAEAFQGFSGCDCQDYYIIVQDEEDYYENNWDLEFPGYSVTQKGFESTLTYINRYYYHTYGLLDICLKENPKDDTRGCDTTGNVLSTSSNSPLEVTEVSQRLTESGTGSVSLRLDYSVEEKSNDEGNIAPYGSLWSGECLYEGMDDPYVEVTFYLDGNVYGCGTIHIEDGEGSDSCTISEILTSNEQGSLYGGEYRDAYLDFEYVWESRDSIRFKVE